MKTVMKLETVYSFDELPEEVQQKVIDNNRDINTDYEWWQVTIDHYIDMFSLCGLDIDNIYFSLGYSQSDYCSFSGASWSYKKGWKKALLSEFGSDHVKKEIIPIFEAMQKQASKVFYDLSFSYNNDGNFRRSYNLSIEDSYTDETYNEIESEIRDLISELEQIVYYALRKQCGWLSNDEQIIETLKSNDYMFTIDGEIYR